MATSRFSAMQKAQRARALWEVCVVRNRHQHQNRCQLRAREELCIARNRKVSASVGLLKGPQTFSIQFLELQVDCYIVVNTELSESARAPARARIPVLPTIEESAHPSASLKGHRNFQFIFWNYMAAFLLSTIQSSACARARGG